MSRNNIENNLSIGFVIYNPDSQFSNRLYRVLSNGYAVYIFDNSPEATFIREEFKSHANVHYFTAGKNVGLGFGLSVVCSNALLDKFKTLLFFDQDTIFSINTLEFIRNFSRENTQVFEDYAAVMFKSSDNKSENCFAIQEKKLIISSGSLFHLHNLESISWHNHNYFVDGVDYEFCLRASRNGYLTGVCYGVPDFDHVSGQEDKPYYIFKLKLYLRAYNIERILDIVVSFNKLIFISIWHFKFNYTVLFLRSILATIFFQLLVRILDKLSLKGKK